MVATQATGDRRGCGAYPAPAPRPASPRHAMHACIECPWLRSPTKRRRCASSIRRVCWRTSAGTPSGPAGSASSRWPPFHACPAVSALNISGQEQA
jgi:hypothetical protein